MNERVIELAKQAAKYADYYAMLSDNAEQEIFTKKFAELIVAECVGKCEFVANMATITNTGEMARKTKATADSCATMIKQHFGVSE